MISIFNLFFHAFLGLLESSTMPLRDSELLAEIMDSIRHQVGVVYPEENSI